MGERRNEWDEKGYEETGPHATVVAAAAALVAVAFAVPALAGGAQVTRGHLADFADGPGLDYSDATGRVQMVRTGDGKTVASVQVAGLTPGATYGSHVHNQSCADGNAGGHYSFGHLVVGGAGPGNSEIWLGPSPPMPPATPMARRQSASPRVSQPSQW